MRKDDMPRKMRLTWPDPVRQNGPVTVTRPNPHRANDSGWTRAQADDLIRQGYSREHAERVTGYKL